MSRLRGSADFLLVGVDDVPFLADGHKPSVGSPSSLRNRGRSNSNPDHEFTVTTEPTEIQSRKVELLDVDPGEMFPVQGQEP